MQDFKDKKSNLLDNIRKRIIYFADNEGGGRSVFMKATGIKKGIFDPKDINRAVGSDKLSNILDSYQNLSAEWLLTGKGSMLKQEKASGEVKKTPISISNSELLDRIERLSADKARLEDKISAIEAEKKIKKTVNYGVSTEPIIEHPRKK